MKKSLGILAALLIVAGLGVTLTYGDPAPVRPRGIMRHPMGMTFPMLLRGVDLTAEQTTQVQQIMANHRSTFRELLGQMHSIHSEIENRILSTENVTEPDLTPQTQQLSQLQSQLADENLKVNLEIRKLLTPDQLVQAVQYREQMHAKWAEMREQFRQKKAEGKNN